MFRRSSRRCLRGNIEVLDIVPGVSLGVGFFEQAGQLITLSTLPFFGRARCPTNVQGMETCCSVQVRGEGLLSNAIPARAIEPGELSGHQCLCNTEVGSCSGESISVLLTFFEARRPKPQTGALQRTILHAIAQLLNTLGGLWERTRDIAV